MIVITIILAVSFIGFQVPVIFSILNASKMNAICAATIKNAKKLKDADDLIKFAFHKSSGTF